MKSKLYCKILALCVVCSFIGIGIQPAFAIDIKQNIPQNENEKDCGCKSVSDTENVYLERQLNKVGVYTKLLMVLGRDNPEIQEIGGELLELINTDSIWEAFCEVFWNIIWYIKEYGDTSFFTALRVFLNIFYVYLCYPPFNPPPLLYQI